MGATGPGPEGTPWAEGGPGPESSPGQEPGAELSEPALADGPAEAPIAGTVRDDPDVGWRDLEATDYQLCVIDTPPGGAELAAPAVAAAHMVVVPCDTDSRSVDDAMALGKWIGARATVAFAINGRSHAGEKYGNPLGGMNMGGGWPAGMVRHADAFAGLDTVVPVPPLRDAQDVFLAGEEIREEAHVVRVVGDDEEVERPRQLDL